MTVILVLTTIVILLAIDYAQSRGLATQAARGVEPGKGRIPALSQAFMGGFEVKENLQYHPGHTWALRESEDLVRVGMDDFAARLIGSMDSIELPKFGHWVRQGQKLCTIRKDGATTDLVSPIEGVVSDVNLNVAETPDVAVRDPYGSGWLIQVQAPDLKTSFRNLLRGQVALRWMEEAAARLRAKLPALAGAVAQDGGVAVREIGKELPDEVWSDLAGEFFLN
jgi:glycine cleavage system H protein